MSNRNTPKISKVDLKAQAEAAMAAFRAKGGVVGQLPSVTPTNFACSTCGHTGVIGVREGQKVRCPKCRTMLSI